MVDYLILKTDDEAGVLRAFDDRMGREDYGFWAKQCLKEYREFEDLAHEFKPVPTMVNGASDSPPPPFILPGRPGVIAGPSKCMKTSFAMALAVHLANGRPFLQLTEGGRRRSVGMVSGEASIDWLLSTARRVATAINGTTENLYLFSDLPSLMKKVRRQTLRRIVDERGLELLIVDPVYRALGGRVDVSSLYSTAARLRTIVETFAYMGVALLFVHHSNRSLEPGQPMQLADMLGAGMPEFFRFWALLNRATAFNPAKPGRHDLVLSCGNCEGSSGLLRLHLNEGTDGSPWALDAVQDEPEAGRKKVSRRQGKAAEGDPEKRVRVALKALQADHGKRIPRTKLQDATKLSGSSLKTVLHAMATAGELRIEAESYLYSGKKKQRYFVVPTGAP
jgi:hypothetical protein